MDPRAVFGYLNKLISLNILSEVSNPLSAKQKGKRYAISDLLYRSLEDRLFVAFETFFCYTLLESLCPHGDVVDLDRCDEEVNVMTNTAAVSKEKLKGIFDTDNLTGTTFKVTITPISKEEAEEIEFKTLKGIAGRPLDVDEVRKERLGL